MHKTQQFFLKFILFMLFILSGCGVLPDSELNKTHVVFWHSWQGDEALVLNNVIDRFNEIFPDIEVISNYIPSEEILDRYQDTASLGLGPDLMLGSDSWIRQLADLELIHTVDTQAIDTSIYFQSALQGLTYQEQLYGIPFSMRPLALYVNSDMVENPATTLEDLLTQANAGNGIAINTRFRDMIWGVQAFGGRILDENGQVILDRGGLANWLNWLLLADDSADVYLSRDDETLLDLFINERVAYYTGDASNLAYIQENLNNMIVVPLPNGPNGASGPFLELVALLFNQSSSEKQTQASLRFAQFLTNIEQSSTFMRELRIVSANRRLRVDARTYPDVAGFIAQTRTAIPIANTPQMDVLLETGNEVIVRVLEGILSPADAATEIASRVNTQFGITTTQNPQSQCSFDGSLTIWHSWSGTSLNVLQDIANDFRQQCPDVALQLAFFPEREILDAYTESIEAGIAPDILLGSSRWIQQLASESLIHTIESQTLQPFIPISQQTVRWYDAVYGIPISLDFQVLYYNQRLVADPAITLPDLLNQASNGIPVGLSINFTETIWGMTAFNGLSVNQNQEVIIMEDEFKQWLAWLESANSTPTITFSQSQTLSASRFRNGESAYLIASPMLAPSLTNRLGDDLQTTLLPSSENGEAHPLLQAEVFYLNPLLAEQALETALAFTTLATNNDYQTQLFQQAGRIPANVNVDTSSVPHINEFLRQAQNGIIIVDTPQNERIFEVGNQLYTDILTQGNSVEDAFSTFLNEIKQG